MTQAPTDLLSIPSPPSHRFVDWHAGTHFAFARGLSVSPQHLPIALDAMLEDGWELFAIFGEPVADRIGFIFRRIPHG